MRHPDHPSSRAKGRMKENLNSAEKVLGVLMALAQYEQGIGTGGLSQELGFTKPTVSRLLHLLMKHGFAQKVPAGSKYVLGNSAVDLGKLANRQIGAQLVPIAKPYIDMLRDAVEESAVLEVLAGDHALPIYRANGPHVVGIWIKPGTLIPAHVSPGAKAILAFSPPETVNRILKKTLLRFTPKTIAQSGALKETFKEIRKRGVAFAFGEYNLDVDTLGAPIFNHEKRPVAAVVISMPAYRTAHHPRSKLVSLLKKTTAKISDQLSHYRI